MLDAAAYRANETNAKRAIADWRLANVNDPYIFQNQGFPVRADSFLDLAQILDTMQEGRFDYYMKELGGFTDEDTSSFVDICLDYIDFYRSAFQRDRVIVPLSTLISHFVVYKKLLGYKPRFSRLLEIGPGCGYLSFFLRDHDALEDYTQIESTESFYLLQSHINSHIFGSRFAEHALSRAALYDHGAYIPKLKWHTDFHYENQKIINVASQPVCNHFPWWRIAEVAGRKYDIVTANANLNEFSREALFQYLSLIREVLADDGAIVAQCLGGGAPTHESTFANMKSAGFVPVALVAGDCLPSNFYVVANGVFVGEKHPLYAQYAERPPQFPMLDRSHGFLSKMFCLNEEQPEKKQVRPAMSILHEIVERIASDARSPTSAARKQGPDSSVRTAALAIETILSSAQERDSSRLRQAAAIEGLTHEEEERTASWAAERVEGERARLQGDVASFKHSLEVTSGRALLQLRKEVASLKHSLEATRNSTSWKITAPLRSVVSMLRGNRARKPARRQP